MHSIFLNTLPTIGLLSLVLGFPAALAQSTSPAGISIPPDAPDALQESIPRPSDTLPSVPIVPPNTSPAPTLQTPLIPPPPAAPDLNLRFPVQQIKVEGSTVLQPEISALVKDYEARDELSFEDLLELRSRITQLYLSNGYITSGAFLPNNQMLTDGMIRIQVVEGTLEAIDLCLLSPGTGRSRGSSNSVSEATSSPLEESSPSNPASAQAQEPQMPAEAEDQCGSARLRESYIRSRLVQADTKPVNQQRIEETLQLLQLNPLIQQVNAELIAGSAPGQNVLTVQVIEASAFRLGIGGDNYQSPSIGSEQFSIQVGHDNLFGVGDRISTGYGITEGLDSFDISYSIPLNPQEGTLSFSYSTDESLIIEQQFEDLDIRSESETFSIGFRQPLIRKPETEVALGLQADLRRSTTFLEGEPFSFSVGPEDGESNVTVLRFSQDWVERDARTVLAARSQFSLGIDALDATVNDTGTDGRFFAWLGQFQWVQRLAPRWVLVSRLVTQLTPDSLLSLERFGYGGVSTVRGYRQNQLVTDNGVLGAVEARFSLLPDSNRFQLVPFAEIGHGWNNESPDPATATLASVGLGVRWAVTPDLAIGLDYGIPLIDVEDEGDSLQDNGLYFSVRYQPF
ncbi:MAG TPA: ShlB/FhaC/HecB family hemolysin secretion/activation protein [Trichocoleus sp.]|jgi:hemolysin activation/secretion protein